MIRVSQFRSGRTVALLVALFALLAVSIAPIVAQDDAAFPVTIEHKFGSTTIEAEPQRVVSIGFTEQDPWLALGVVPVAVRYWYGDETNAIFPWAEEAAGDAEIEVLNMAFGSLNYEAILALQPDLISAIDSGITQEEYDLLSQIAPTIAQSDEYIDFGTPWQVTTQTIGTIAGKTEEAEALIEAVESQIETAREENPEFEGQNVAVAYQYAANSYGIYTDQDGRARFFTQLGFVIPEVFIELAGDSFYYYLSTERLDLLDQDLLIFLALQFTEGGQEAIESDPLITQLSAVQEGRVVFIPTEYDDALQFGTVLSLPYALEGILPQLQAVYGTSEATPEATAEAGS